jgi:2-oxoglutarate dehydrogenase E2 component (dihydrolipoamide succinyltransferase)
MAVEIKIPSVGESVTEGTIGRWLKPDGAVVQANEPVLEVETDKASQEIIAPATGALKIAVKEGEKVAVGTVVGHIDPAGKPAPAKAVEPTPKQPPAPAPKPPVPAGAAKAAPAPSAGATPRQGDDIPLSPAVRQLLREEGIDAAHVTGTGRGGRITKEDVLAHLATKQAGKDGSPRAEAAATVPPARSASDGAERPSLALRAGEAKETQPRTPQPPAAAGQRTETRQRMTTIRQRIAERLLAAQQNAAILTTFNEADLSAVLALRTTYKEAFQKKHGVGLGFMSFFVKSAIEALKAFPSANARIDGNEIVYHHYYDIGVAVSTDKGLMVPVLRDADRLSFAAIEQGIAELANKARDNKITVQDLQGGTFTITNGGIFGSLLSTPILNPPQSGILGMHAIQKRPIAVDDQVVIRPMMYVAFSYDHRLIDGREAVGFLVRVKECIESPERLLLET